ncbi:MAG: hypothetical protein IK079_06400 [Desulfovibrio sp.]|nr:hypothetical protein [Desulfovibrio sp.]
MATCNIKYLGNGDLYPVVQEVGTKIVLLALDSVLEFDCAILQKDVPIHIDIMEGSNGKMVVGLDYGDKYIANIDIPAAKFEFRPGKDDTVEKFQVPFTNADLASVKVTLWKINPVQTTETMSE